jgi:hypothetical protein
MMGISMNRQTLGLLLGAACLAATMPMLAHHSISAEFDTNQPITFTGKVKRIDWMNPHIYTHVEAEDAAKTVLVYRVEGAAPNALFRRGWRKDTLKIGETVTIAGIRSKNPASMNIGQATITRADGSEVFTSDTQSYRP